MTTTDHIDWAAEMFPGDGSEIPDDAERDRADELITEWNHRWNETHPPIARVHADRPGSPVYRVDPSAPTNRAFLRAQLRRWWAKP